MATEEPPKQQARHVEQQPAASIDNELHGSSASQPTTWYMVVFSFWIGLFGWIANFDAAFGGIVLVMDPYKQDFGACVTSKGQTTCTISALQQSLIQLTTLFMSVGGGLAGVTSNYIGRRGTVQMGCLFVAIGAAGMIGSSGSFTNYMVCKCIGGVGIGQLYTAAPTWGSESVSPSKRGFLMSFYNVGLASGNVVAAAVCVGSSRLTTSWSWKTPIICQIPAAMILAACSIFFHESPRWLLTKGREEKARKSFAAFFQKDAHSPEVNWQISQVLYHTELERAQSRETSWTEIFYDTNLKRTHIAVLVLLGNALTGIQFVIPYTALFLAQLGLNNPYLLNVAISSCVLAGTIPGPFLCEYVGRRRSLICGYIIMAASMLIFAAVSSGLGQSDVTAQHVLVAFLCIWAFTFGATSGPIVWVSSAEMHAIRLRTFGQSYSVLIYEIFAFSAAFWTPYMLNASYGNMGTNVGYFYFGITIVIIALTWLFVPETGRLSLEQVDDYFGSSIPAWKTSLRNNKLIASRKCEIWPMKRVYEGGICDASAEEDYLQESQLAATCGRR